MQIANPFLMTSCLFISVLCRLVAVELAAPDNVEQGDMLQIAIKGQLLTDVTLTLINSAGQAVQKADGFTWVSPEGKEINVVLLGIAPDFIPGRYFLDLRAMDGTAEWKLEKPIKISKYETSEEVIKLTDSMNALLTENEERKKREAQVFWAVLNSFNPFAFNHPGIFINPIHEGVITSDFGERRRYIKPEGSESSSIHFGRDLWQKTGTPIHASGKGRVVMATERYLTGNTVILEHLPGVYSLYYHLDTIQVGLGEMISQGAILGTLGATGFASGEHLHWEMRVGGVPVQISRFLYRPLLDRIALLDILKKH